MIHNGRNHTFRCLEPTTGCLDSNHWRFHTLWWSVCHFWLLQPLLLESCKSDTYVVMFASNFMCTDVGPLLRTSGSYIFVPMCSTSWNDQIHYLHKNLLVWCTSLTRTTARNKHFLNQKQQQQFSCHPLVRLPLTWVLCSLQQEKELYIPHESMELEKINLVKR